MEPPKPDKTVHVHFPPRQVLICSEGSLATEKKLKWLRSFFIPFYFEMGQTSLLYRVQLKCRQLLFTVEPFWPQFTV